MTTVATYDEVEAVVTDGEALYWTLVGPEGGRIVSAPINGGAPATLVDESGAGIPTDLLVQDGRLWWVERDAEGLSSGRLMTASMDGSMVQPLGGSESVVNPVVYGGNVYFESDTGIVRVDGTTGARATLLHLVVSEAWTLGLAVDETYVYTFLQQASCSFATLIGIPKGGGQPVNLATEDVSADQGPGINDLVADGSRVLWAVNNGYAPAIRAVPSGGGTVTTLGATGSGGAASLHSQENWLYFADNPTDATADIERLPLTDKTSRESAVTPLSAYPALPGYGGAGGHAFAVAGATVYWGGYDASLVPTVFCARAD